PAATASFCRRVARAAPPVNSLSYTNFSSGATGKQGPGAPREPRRLPVLLLRLGVIASRGRPVHRANRKASGHRLYYNSAMASGLLPALRKSARVTLPVLWRAARQLFHEMAGGLFALFSPSPWRFV